MECIKALLLMLFLYLHSLANSVSYKSIKSVSSVFLIYWNVPSEMCHKYGMNFSELQKYGLTQNTNDKFRGDQIIILYDPGLFPAIFDDSLRNNGIPQDGNLTKHLLHFKEELETTLPEKNFSGVGVIDFEHWRPIWRENWGSLDKYRKKSIEVEKSKHYLWPEETIMNTAIERFENGAFNFFKETLLAAITLRPQGQWGYYAFPYCYNVAPKNPATECIGQVSDDNDRSSWMYKTGNALYPSIYLREKQLNEKKRMNMIQGRIDEAKRIAKKVPNKKINIFPYLAIKYQDTFSFLSKQDMFNAIETSRKAGIKGLILWGSSKDTNSFKSCQEIQDYINIVIRPIMKKIFS